MQFKRLSFISKVNLKSNVKRRRSAHLISWHSQRFWIRPTLPPLKCLWCSISHANDHDKPGQRLLPRSAILSNNNRVHYSIATFGSGNNGKLHHLPSANPGSVSIADFAWEGVTMLCAFQALMLLQIEYLSYQWFCVFEMNIIRLVYLQLPTAVWFPNNNIY